VPASSVVIILDSEPGWLGMHDHRYEMGTRGLPLEAGTKREPRRWRDGLTVSFMIAVPSSAGRPSRAPSHPCYERLPPRSGGVEHELELDILQAKECPFRTAADRP
jgi:hypothetical protein